MRGDQRVEALHSKTQKKSAEVVVKGRTRGLRIMGTASSRRVFFLPILSIMVAARSDPMEAPALVRDVIDNSSNGVIGLSNELSFVFSKTFNFGRTE
jgi:hypothetical protein